MNINILRINESCIGGYSDDIYSLRIGVRSGDDKLQSVGDIESIREVDICVSVGICHAESEQFAVME